MSVEFHDGRVTLRVGDAMAELDALDAASIDSVVTDPPYNLGFMGKAWDKDSIAYHPDFWAKVLRVLKPGGHVLAFSGTRTQHRMVIAIEDAGFEIRDQIGWAYGSGFPKSHDVAKGIDRALGATREIIGTRIKNTATGGNDLARNNGQKTGAANFSSASGDERVKYGNVELEITAPATDAARQWQGWGTALKPSFEPVCVAQKPLISGQIIDMIGSELARLWSRLWSMLPVKDADHFSMLSPSAYGVDVSVFAQWTAEEKSNSLAALSDQMDTSQFALAIASSLSTVCSWNHIWEEASQKENTFTIETELNPIIELKTLKFSLSKITPESIIQAHKEGTWSIANASPAERIFNAAVMKLNATLELSVAENALGEALISSPEEIGGIKPNWRPICVARKPLIGTVAANVLAHGVGGLNIDATRIEGPNRDPGFKSPESKGTWGSTEQMTNWADADKGRWPANLVHDGSDEVLACFPDVKSGVAVMRNGGGRKIGGDGIYGGSKPHGGVPDSGYADSGSAARFFASFPIDEDEKRLFYCPKANAADRINSRHPTVKPLDLMRWLVRLVTPPGGLVLDPFAGTGTTGHAALLEGMRAILIEREAEYQADIANRMEMAFVSRSGRKNARVKKTDDHGPLFGTDAT